MQERELQQQLINRIRKGDNDAVKELYAMAYAYCASFVLKNQGTEEDAEDLFQRSMLIFLEKLQDKNFEIKYNIKSFLYAIVRNQWLKELKNRHIIISLVNEEGKEIIILDEDDLESEKEKESDFQKIAMALETVSPECRKLIELTFLEQKKDKEIAPLMNYSHEFVRNKRSRCIRHIKKILGLS